jgi:CheY-like chemotaxis protein
VLHLNLPRLDGVSILRFLRTRKPSMPILVLTGRNRVETGCCVWTTIWESPFHSPNCRLASGP